MNVLLLDGEALYSASVLYCLAAARRTVHIGSATRFADVRFSRLSRKFRCWHDDSQLLEDVSAYARKEGIAMILACSDPGIRFISRYRPELESVAAVAGTASLESLDTAIDKSDFAHFLSRTMLPHPETIVLDGGEPIPASLPAFPALLKPALGSGGELITRFDQPGEFRSFAGQGGLASRRWILQSYICGREIGCSVLCRRGKILAYTIQSSVKWPAASFAPIGAVDFVEDEEALRLTEKLVSALDWTGIAHIDMLRAGGNGRLLVLEMNGRYWASMIGSFRAGVNFPELACLDALGRNFACPEPRRMRFVRGTLRTVWQEARRPAETTLFWRLADPGPLLAHYVKSCLRARASF
jgi:D-aspartate ligase